MANDYERFKARMAAWEARAKVVEHPDETPKSAPRPKYEIEHKTLLAARSRCENPRHRAYKYYGARGIRVCRQWSVRGGYRAFVRHIGPRPGKGYSLDRIDNDRGYEPGNVRWATRTEQANNRRSSRWITWRGATHTAAEWGRLLAVRRQEIVKRANRGKPLK